MRAEALPASAFRDHRALSEELQEVVGLAGTQVKGAQAAGFGVSIEPASPTRNLFKLLAGWIGADGDPLVIFLDEADTIAAEVGGISSTRSRRPRRGNSPSGYSLPGRPTRRAAFGRREPSRKGCSNTSRSGALNATHRSARSASRPATPACRSTTTRRPCSPRSPGITRTSSNCSAAPPGQPRTPPTRGASPSKPPGGESPPSRRASSAPTLRGSTKRAGARWRASWFPSRPISETAGGGSANWNSDLSCYKWPGGNRFPVTRPGCSTCFPISACSGRLARAGGRWAFQATRDVTVHQPVDKVARRASGDPSLKRFALRCDAVGIPPAFLL